MLHQKIDVTFQETPAGCKPQFAGFKSAVPGYAHQEFHLRPLPVLGNVTEPAQTVHGGRESGKHHGLQGPCPRPVPVRRVAAPGELREQFLDLGIGHPVFRRTGTGFPEITLLEEGHGPGCRTAPRDPRRAAGVPGPGAVRSASAHAVMPVRYAVGVPVVGLPGMFPASLPADLTRDV